MAWSHKGFSIIKHTKSMHGLSGIASSCTKQGYQNYEKPIKNNTELHAWSVQGYQPLKHTHIRACIVCLGWSHRNRNTIKHSYFSGLYWMPELVTHWDPSLLNHTKKY